MAREWDAGTYDRVADPMTRWGAAVLERMPLRGHERVLDAGCGSGRVTELLADRLPEGTVVALDGSAAMVDAARTRLARFGHRIEYVVADLLEALPIEPVDAILSTATFHWVLDHDRLFRNLAAVLRPGGRLVAQCGGAGNIARVNRVVRELGIDETTTHLFATAEATAERLEAAGFEDIRTWLQPEPTRIDDAAWESYLRTVCLSGYLARMPEAERDAFVGEVIRRLERPELDYVRLNIDATRAATR
jgi:trans-aconitate 2-methyltransferase